MDVLAFFLHFLAVQCIASLQASMGIDIDYRTHAEQGISANGVWPAVCCVCCHGEGDRGQLVSNRVGGCEEATGGVRSARETVQVI